MATRGTLSDVVCRHRAAAVRRDEKEKKLFFTHPLYFESISVLHSAVSGTLCTCVYLHLPVTHRSITRAAGDPAIRVPRTALGSTISLTRGALSRPEFFVGVGAATPMQRGFL